LCEWKYNNAKVEEECCWAITRTKAGGGGLSCLVRIRFHCVAVWISAGLLYVHLYGGPSACSVSSWAELDLLRTFPNVTTAISRAASVVDPSLHGLPSSCDIYLVVFVHRLNVRSFSRPIVVSYECIMKPPLCD